MLKPVITTSSAIVMCPANPTSPPIMQRSPITVLPEMPVQAAMIVCAPMRDVVPDLDLVVELDAVADHGVLDRAAIDGRVGADLDVIADAHAADLRDLEPAALFAREPEAVGADHAARMQHAARADAHPRPQRHPGHELGIVA